jgi:hypothetical protein
MKPSSSKLWILLLCCLGWIPSQAENLPPLPAQKLPPNLPKFAAWEISLQYAAGDGGDGATNPDAVADSPGESRSRPEKVLVTRTDDLIREEVFWSDNKKTQKWIYKKLLQVFEESQGGRLFRIPTTTLADDFSDYSKGDFTELAWIGPQNYRGITVVNERPCFLFSTAPGTVISAVDEELSTYMPEELRGSKGNTREFTATIDAETLLPVFFSDGYVTKTYRILPAPTSALKMPPEVLAVFEDWIERIREARRVPGPP